MGAVARLVPFLLAVGLLTSCTAQEGTTTVAPSPVTSTTVSAPSPTATTDTVWAPDPEFGLRVGVLHEVPRFNPWVTLSERWGDGQDFHVTSMRTTVLLGDAGTLYGVPEPIALYRLIPPTASLVPMLAAAAEPPLGRQEGAAWVIDVPLRAGVTWSDGQPVSAADIAFTFRAAASMGIDPTGTQSAQGGRLLAVEEVDPTTVRIIWDSQPSAAAWHLGLALTPILSVRYWAPLVEGRALAEVVEMDGRSAPTAGPYRVGRVDEDHWSLLAVPSYWEAGGTFSVWPDGSVRYDNPTLGLSEAYGKPSGVPAWSWHVGPHAARVDMQTFEGYDTASFAMQSNELDIFLHPMGAGMGLLAQSPHLQASWSPNSFRAWTAFNTRHFPMSDPAFRRAVSCMVDRGFLAEHVLSENAFPSHAWAPLDDGIWFGHNADVCTGDAEARFTAATAVLSDGGWTWTTEPRWSGEEGVGGGGLSMGGQEAPALTVWSPGPADDPLAATAALWVADWMQQLGIEVVAEDVPGDDLGMLVSQPDGWDMAVLTSPIDPIPLELTIPSSGSATDYTGFDDPSFASSAVQASAAVDLRTLAVGLAELDQVLTLDALPLLPLYEYGIWEWYAPTIVVPLAVPIPKPEEPRFESTALPMLGGLQGFDNLLAAIKPKR